MNKFLIVLFALIILAGGIFAWYWKSNSFSKEVLKLEIEGPKTALVGQEVEYSVKLKNNGSVRLEQADLSFEYPQNAVLPEGQQQIASQEIGDIYPGDEKIFNFKCRLFGQENDKMEVRAVVTYQPKNLQAKYDRETSFTTSISQAPLTLEFDMPLKISHSEKVDIFINYFSNVDYPLENLRMKVEYPEGFTFLSSQPRALDKTEWMLSALVRANGGRVAISGNLEGEEGDKKNFKAQLGVIRDGEFILLKEVFAVVEISESSLYVSQLVNGSQNYSVSPGESLHYEIFFKNIGKKPVQKNFLVVRLGSNLFNLQSIKSQNGDSAQGDNSIVWDWKEVPALNFLDVDEEGRVEFWVKIKNANEITLKTPNPSLLNSITVGGVERSFEIKMNTAVDFTQRVFYNEEVFGNEGPLPPEVDVKTTYTVFWHIKNSWNKLENVKVKTTLPKNVVVSGNYFPEDAKFTYDSDSKEVVWNVGALEAFKGNDPKANPPLTLAFQIEFTPDISQTGKQPNLVAESEMSGNDSFTSDVITTTADFITTAIPDDKVADQDGVVK